MQPDRQQQIQKTQSVREQRREYLLAAMRTGRLRLRAEITDLQLLNAELEECGVALRCGMVSPEDAAGWLDQIGALPFITTGSVEVS